MDTARMSGLDRRWGDIRGALGADQLGPDAVPVVGAEIPERIAWLHFVPVARQSWACRFDPTADLVGVLLINAESGCDLFAALEGV